jgi:hypothetical protein
MVSRTQRAPDAHSVGKMKSRLEFRTTDDVSEAAETSSPRPEADPVDRATGAGIAAFAVAIAVLSFIGVVLLVSLLAP